MKNLILATAVMISVCVVPDAKAKTTVDDVCTKFETIYRIKKLPWITVLQVVPSDFALESGWCKRPEPDLSNLKRGEIAVWYSLDEDGTCNPKAVAGK